MIKNERQLAVAKETIKAWQGWLAEMRADEKYTKDELTDCADSLASLQADAYEYERGQS